MAEHVYLTHGLKAPSLRDAVQRLAERARARVKFAVVTLEIKAARSRAPQPGGKGRVAARSRLVRVVRGLHDEPTSSSKPTRVAARTFRSGLSACLTTDLSYAGPSQRFRPLNRVARHRSQPGRPMPSGQRLGLRLTLRPAAPSGAGPVARHRSGSP